LPSQFKFGQKIFPTHLARRSRDLPTNDKNGAPRCKRFSKAEFFKKKQTALRCACVARLMRTILLLILILLLLGALPTWPYSTGWGYYPSGGLGLILVIVIILAVTGRV
jgi:sterol desaturase/sphingolipid hydroxylase (fatty acid hydroxylase superfamily)